MAKSKETFGKKQKEKKRLKKRQDKIQKKEERKSNSLGGGLENMMAYLDENGNITDTPPDPLKRKKEIDIESIEIGVPKREKLNIATIRKGKVDYFNGQKGFGFIKEFETQEKYFVHINGLTEEVKEGDTVSFELERGMKGMNAIKVKKE